MIVFHHTRGLRALVATAAFLAAGALGPLAPAGARATVPATVPASCADLPAPTADGMGRSLSRPAGSSTSP
ncbi:hypothetical protein ABH926_008459 [Catenulispora sp. GP43]|uniref:hypothetical protein n=1 Tax=Catenulispora sp. GP43 TaxID=3156263 RepID=UPI003516BD59